MVLYKPMSPCVEPIAAAQPKAHQNYISLIQMASSFNYKTLATAAAMATSGKNAEPLKTLQEGISSCFELSLLAIWRKANNGEAFTSLNCSNLRLHTSGHQC